MASRENNCETIRWYIEAEDTKSTIMAPRYVDLIDKVDK
jgi:hypothetical protein